MQINAIVAAAKKPEPTFPRELLPIKVNRPKAAKIKAKTPAVNNPKLNNGPVIPVTTPRSLSALFVQLNCG